MATPKITYICLIFGTHDPFGTHDGDKGTQGTLRRMFFVTFISIKM